MNVDNFIVRPHRQVVDKFAKPEAWQSLTEEDRHDLSNEVAKLPSALSDDDEDAKRFDLLLLKTQLTILQAGTEFSSLKQKIQAIASALEEHESIPAIKGGNHTYSISCHRGMVGGSYGNRFRTGSP